MQTLEFKPDTITTLTLNRPEVHNAFNEVLISELTNTLNEIDENKTIRAVVLNANGKHFCAGADLNWMQQMSSYNFDQNKADALQLAQLLQRIVTLSKPIIAVTQGRTMGGGCGLLAACDLVYATPTAEFCFSEVKLGLIPATIAPYVIRRIGPSQANRFFITAEMIDAPKAHACNLIDEICESNTVFAEAIETAESILKNGPEAIAKVKRLINHLNPIDSFVADYTATELAHVRSSAEAKAGLQAFFAKQKPNWS